MAIKKIEFDGHTLIDLTADTVTADKMRSGITAHDADGNIITGNMGTASVSHSGGGLTQGAAEGGGVSGGDISGGGLTAGSGEVSITQQPAVTPNISGTGVTTAAQDTYGVTTTKPTGTDGTNYLTFDPGASFTKQAKAKGRGSVTRATITRSAIATADMSKTVTRAAVTDTHTAGYLSARAATTVINAAFVTVTMNAGNKAAAQVNAASATSNWSGEASSAGTVNAGTTRYIPVSHASATGGTASIVQQPTATATTTASSASISTTGIKTSTSNTGYSVTASANSGSASASANSGNSTATGGSASVTKGVTAGAQATGTTATSTAVTKDASSPAKTASTIIYIQKATTSKTDAIVEAVANAGTASIAKEPTASASVTSSGITDGISAAATSYSITGSASAASGYSTATGGSAKASVTASSAAVTEGYSTGVSVSTAAKATGLKTGTPATSTEKQAAASTVIYLKASSSTMSGGALSGSSTGGALSGGGLSGGGTTGGELTAGAGSVAVTASNALTVAETTAGYTGYLLMASGSGTVSRAAVTRAAINRAAVTSATVTTTITSATVTCTHTAGYKPAGTTNKNSASKSVYLSPQTLAAGSIAATVTMAATSKASNTATKYFAVNIPSASWSNVEFGNASDSVRIVQTAGYTDQQYLKELTVSAGTKFGELTIAGLSSTVGTVNRIWDRGGHIVTLDNSDTNAASSTSSLAGSPTIDTFNNGANQYYGSGTIKTLNNGNATAASYVTGYINNLNNNIFGEIKNVVNNGTITNIDNAGTCKITQKTSAKSGSNSTLTVEAYNPFTRTTSTKVVGSNQNWQVPNENWFVIYPEDLNISIVGTAYIWLFSSTVMSCLCPTHTSSAVFTISGSATQTSTTLIDGTSREFIFYIGGEHVLPSGSSIAWGLSTGSSIAPFAFRSFSLPATANFLILRLLKRSPSLVAAEILYLHK